MLLATLELKEDSLQLVFSVGDGMLTQEIFCVMDKDGKIIPSEAYQEQDNQLVLLLLEKYQVMAETLLDLINKKRKE